ncbi:hypothetical protein [Candidatus Vondammii sp. HM_W22]|uniref:hypothetical protein n=1 Tax=Candidatus Vondammii sp. HM_W22 TaxID=2687299 RepID=UPI001F12F588|nr:hypothetical protein [Candidatus Vondammii sp. HM_W22]
MVVDTFASLPKYIKEESAGQHVDGAYDPGTGQIYLVANAITSKRHALRVLAHEAVGHYSMEAMLGNEFQGILKKVNLLKRVGGKRINEIAAEVDRRYEGLSEDAAAAEVIAVMAEKGIRNSVMKRVYAAIRKFLKKDRVPADVHHE